MRFFFIAIFLSAMLLVKGQVDTTHFIKVHFLYGSKPLKKYKHTEAKYFGGLHGGHVSIEVDNIDYGFVPEGKLHIFAHKRSCHSAFITKETHGRNPYTDKDKVVTFLIPVTAAQHDELIALMNTYCSKSPYDYAFFGMRCAAATQDVLGKIGVVRPKRKCSNVFKTFYPKKLRKRLFKQAKAKNYTVHFHEGRKSRKWEMD